MVKLSLLSSGRNLKIDGSDCHFRQREEIEIYGSRAHFIVLETEQGSSIKMISGFVAMARAIHRHCR
jgi:hypothetical protein